jgi:LmbE family N-acetylglucosaminyl deacetylase
MDTQFRVRMRSRQPSQPSAESTLSAALGAGPWLLLAPHDDDFILGAGLAVAAALVQGIDVHVAVATDGSLGYVRPEEQGGLVATRERELSAAAAQLGLPAPNLHRLNFPDGSLIAHQGCRGADQPDSLGQRLVTLLRALRPSSVFVCTPEDVHPDHRVCASECEIACVWAASQIWLERGAPIAEPQRFHYAVYAAFMGAPDVQVAADPAALELKLGALRCFESQGVIEPMIERLRQAGPYEYFQHARSLRYEPEQYAELFGDKAK